MPLGIIGPGHHISRSGISETCLKLVGSWLRDCDGHSLCKGARGSVLPTRLIFIGSTTNALRLHAPQSCERVRYVALSHCWGGTSPLKTTTANLQDHYKKISHCSMPKTFADAISVTKSLGIQYLWIDALCVIQDSPKDRSSEAASMGRIYANAYFTISADAAVDSSSGFIRPPSRKNPRFASFKYFHNDYKGQKGPVTIHVREKGNLFSNLPFHGWDPTNLSKDQPLKKMGLNKFGTIPDCLAPPKDSPHSKLSTRGWAFQERVLSPRTLFFGPSELGWECRGAVACECSTKKEGACRNAAMKKDWNNGESWPKLVTEYTKLDLTFPYDRLTAISGLAGELASQKGPYIAGLWQTTFANDLLWQAKTSGDLTRFKTYHAPTWSWASVSGPVECYPYRLEADGEPTVHISKSLQALEIQYELSSINPYGALYEGAYAIVMGMVVDVEVDIWPDMVTVSTQALCDDRFVLKARLDTSCETGSFAQPANQKAMFLMISKHMGPSGLLLRRVSADENYEDVFERIGFAYKLPTIRRRCTFESDVGSLEREPGDPRIWDEWVRCARERRLKLV